MAEQLLTAREVAEALRVHLNTVHRLIHAGDLRAYKVARDWRIKRSDLDAYLEATQSRYEATRGPL
jgi:excisionase family DNA binding protein